MSSPMVSMSFLIQPILFSCLAINELRALLIGYNCTSTFFTTETFKKLFSGALSFFSFHRI